MAASTGSPCAACKFLRRKCTSECVFAPYFPPEDPQKFATVHKLFGASNVSKLLMELPLCARDDLVSSLAYEADARIKDPIYGCAGAIANLQCRIAQLQVELISARSELCRLKVHSSNDPLLQSEPPFRHLLHDQPQQIMSSPYIHSLLSKRQALIHPSAPNFSINPTPCATLSFSSPNYMQESKPCTPAPYPASSSALWDPAHVPSAPLPNQIEASSAPPSSRSQSCFNNMHSAAASSFALSDHHSSGVHASCEADEYARSLASSAGADQLSMPIQYTQLGLRLPRYNATSRVHHNMDSASSSNSKSITSTCNRASNSSSSSSLNAPVQVIKLEPQNSQT